MTGEGKSVIYDDDGDEMAVDGDGSNPSSSSSTSSSSFSFQPTSGDKMDTC